MKGKFTQRWLAASDEYYSPVFARLFYAQFNYIEKSYGVSLDLITPEMLEADDTAITKNKIRTNVESKGCTFNENELWGMAYLEISEFFI